MANRSKEAEDPAAAPAVTKSGRVRKKSAKVLEMEEAEKMEKSLSKKVQDTVKGLRETLGGMTVLAKKTPTKVSISIPSLQKSASAASTGSVVNIPTTAVNFMEGDGELVDSVVQPPPGAVNPVFPPSAPVQSGSKRKAEQNSKKSKSKRGTGTPAPVMLGQPPCLAESPLRINVSNSALPAVGSILPETTPPLKLKLVLSPTKETSLCDAMDVISPSSYDMELDDGGGVLQIAEPTSAPKKRLKKKKKRKCESEGSTGLKTLLLGKAAASKKKKKSSKKQMTMSQSTDEEEFMATMNAFGQEHTEAEDGLDMKLPVYANTSEMALKLKTSAERKASKQRKYKRGKPKEDPLKPRKRRAPTAYMLWCASYRQKVITETPGIDFVQMSKRLGELWQALPEKQKMGWKRKARKAATKGTVMISTGKTGHVKSGHMGTLLQSGQHQVKSSTSKRAVIHGEGHTIAGQSDQENKMIAFNVGCQPIDAAAHLKLLGESLSVIGARLKEHVGPGTIQGSVSVLLDSLICALCPLMCLTKQVKELDGCSKDTLIHTLDNIAYVMPGIG